MGEERRAISVSRAVAGGGGCLCVVLAGQGAPRPDELLDGLEKRGAAVQVVNHPTGVMVELAGGARAVIVNEPTRVARLPGLLAAVRRYYPKAVCWQFTQDGHGGEPELSRISMNGAASQPPPLVGEGGRLRRPGEGSPGKFKTAPTSSAPVGRKSPPHPSPLPQGERGPEKTLEKAASPVISAEELAMLLAPLPERAEDWATQEDGTEGEE